MVRDRGFKLICIPLLGLVFPLSSDLSVFASATSIDLFFVLAYFIFCSFLILQGTIAIISAVRHSKLKEDIFSKLVVMCTATGALAFCAAIGALLLRQFFFKNMIDVPALLRGGLASGGIVVFITLVYEVLFLNKERQIDGQIVRHLDKELLQAEINVLRNELDPHFVYNSLMPLYYLVKNDIQKAEAFAYKLIQVYQYFVENRQNDFVTLREELSFIENYFFLLQIRYKDSVSLSVQIPNNAEKFLVLPSSLQALIENAIKHNELDKHCPLHITISIERNCLVVSNNLRCKGMEITSSKIGLRNLRTRYKVLTGSDISVIKNKELFIVKLPVIRNSKAYDVNSYNRG
jgi:two-component system LytT family sensor kinase